MMKSTYRFNAVEFTEVIKEIQKTAPKVYKQRKGYYYNIPCAFDIETTSFYRDDHEKAACMYEWTLGIDDTVFIGRTWEEFAEAFEILANVFKLWNKNRLIIYVHNLAFEFQFIRNRFEWEQVFAMDTHKPLYALTLTGVEFRCSYLLSGYSLAFIGENMLHKYPVKKMVGDLDYSLMRHSGTPMIDKELGYCENDVRVVMSYIREKMDAAGDISRIPYTKTGYVREYCRECCLYDPTTKHHSGTKKWKNYRSLMKGMTLESDEYIQLKNAFMGGFTHASAWKSGKVYENVGSFDFTSSYPAQLLANEYPMSKGEVVKITSGAEFLKNIKRYCCLFDVEIFELEPKIFTEHPLSVSRCKKLVGWFEDNGRIVSAKHLITTITEQDYLVLKEFYTWKRFKIGTFRRYRKGYLPTDFVKSILELYKGKTELKGVKGKETEYLNSKEMLNSCYGMCVTDIFRPEYVYAEGWITIPGNLEQQIEKYNSGIRRFLFYPWGVWCTAYARRALFTGIKEFGTDYIYSDTDSIKALNIENHTEYIEKYNRMITNKLETAMMFHGIDKAAIRPKTIKGIEKPLGVWDFEGTYQKFKTLGAKRYMTLQDDELSITVSGVNKKFAVPYLKEKYSDPFAAFEDDLVIPEDYTGKNIHTYIEYPQKGRFVDYLGNEGDYNELSSVHLEKTEYHLSLSRAYIEYLMGIREESK